jgi:probable rRNA maturation factor
MASKSKVYFFFDTVSHNLRSRRNIKEAIESLFTREGKSLKSLNYIFCNDNTLLTINQNYLNHDYLTDIITFDLSEDSNVVGEIYISADRVRDNARQLQLPVFEEQLRIIFHGALHLCGYRDKTKALKEKMRQKEDYYIRDFKKRFT